MSAGRRRPPFVVCTTQLSAADLRWVRDAVISLGWRFDRELTSSVTHLIAATAGSAKHRAAWRVPGLVVVRKGWLEAWKRAKDKASDGEELDVDENDFLFKPLEGFSVSLSGFASEEKERLACRIRELGAGYAQDLSAACSHLVAAIPSGLKYDFAKANGITVVRAEWIESCARMGRIVEEQDFSIEESIGRLENYRKEIPHVEGSKGMRDVSRQTPNQDQDSAAELFLDGCCVLLLGFHQMEVLPIAKSLRLAGATRMFRCSPLVTHGIVSDRAAENGLEWENKRDLLALESKGIWFVRESWVSESLRTKKPALASDHRCKLPSENQTTSLPKKQCGMIRELAPDASKKSTLFLGLRFDMEPFGRQTDSSSVAIALQDRIERHGGKVLVNSRRDDNLSAVSATHVVFANQRDFVLITKSELTVTAEWIDQCICHDKLLQTDSCVLFRPTTFPFEIPEFKDFQFTISGFQAETTDFHRRRQTLTDIIQRTGASYSERLRKSRTTHLLYESKDSEKYTKACEWGVRVVTSSWLVDCVRAGRLMAPSDAENRHEERGCGPVSIKGVTKSLKLSVSVFRNQTSNSFSAPKMEGSPPSPFVKRRTNESNRFGRVHLAQSSLLAEKAEKEKSLLSKIQADLSKCMKDTLEPTRDGVLPVPPASSLARPRLRLEDLENDSFQGEDVSPSNLDDEEPAPSQVVQYREAQTPPSMKRKRMRAL